MDKNIIIDFFDDLAPNWDSELDTDEMKVAQIMDAAGIKPGVSVLDVACGTGVLFPYYLSRDVSCVKGVDISREMIKIASSKVGDERIKLVCGDIETLTPDGLYDRCVIYNAFPHFPDPAGLIEHLAKWLKPGGRLTVAHSMSLEQLKKIHAGSAAKVSRDMLSASELKALMSGRFDVDTGISDDEKYIVSGTLRTGK